MQTRRFHVSGITPAISKTELATRFATFGTVKAIDGVGSLDALGQPRKFGYVTLEATPDKFSKCLNVLSGSMWKGTKLRIGDAKPDYLQRLLNDRRSEQQVSSKRSKVSRDVQGRESRNMDLVTPENVDGRVGWKRTSLSHLVRPIRMRPLHPIGRSLQSPINLKKRRRRISRVLTRLRRQKIDPTQFGAVHLTEAMLQADVITVHPILKPTFNDIRASISPSNGESNAIAKTQAETVSPTPSEPQDQFQVEKARDLDILSRLFGDKDEWEGRETDFEEKSSEGGSKEDHKDDELAEKVSLPESRVPSDTEQSDGSSERSIYHAEPPPSTATRLKDLFVGRPPPESTSILAGLDLELEDDLIYGSMPIDVQETIQTETAIYTKIDRGSRTELGNLDFSTNTPYFFPLVPGDLTRGGTKDIFTISQAQGWTRELTNTGSSEDVKARWEAQKVGLTKSWKQRHREAVKRQRRGGGIDVLE